MARRIFVALFCLFAGLSANSPKGNAEIKRSLMCRYENAFVPCVRLSRLSRPQFSDPRLILYGPLMAIPIWPNNAILGGYEKSIDDLRSENKEYFNRPASAESSARDRDIRTIPFTNFTIGQSFIDSSFMNIHDPDQRLLVRTSEVYRGNEVLSLWIALVSKGVICEEVHNPDVELNNDGPAPDADDTELISECAFARHMKPSPDYARRMRIQ
jgi:hypothetical protein